MRQTSLPLGGDLADGDRYSTWDAAYVLGSLPSNERAEYAAHLETCERCRAAVAELSGIPAVLATLDLEDVRQLDEEEPGPPLRPEVLGSVLDKVRWRRRRSRWLTVAVGVAAALLAVGLVIAIRPEIVGLQTRAPETTAQGMEMTKMAETPINASITLTSYSWGTRIDMACTYGGYGQSGSRFGPPQPLGMVVLGRDGSRTQVATWLGLSGATALPSANTPMQRDEIAAVQMVSSDNGKVLLEKRL